MSRNGLRLLGSALIVYGLAGALLLVAIGATVARPLDELNRLSSSLAEQREAAVESLEAASETIRQTAGSVRNMETSLLQAKVSTDRASGISHGVAESMRGLAGQMGITILGVQPLIGLAASFEQSAINLDLLADDVAAIGAALEANRGDAVAVADGLDELGRSIDRLRVAVAGGPDPAASVATLEPLRLAMLALVGWLLVAALGSILAGLGLWWASRGVRRQPDDHSIVE